MRKRTAQTLSFLVIVILFVIGTIAFRSCYSKKPSENVGLSKNSETEPVNTSILPSSASLEDTDYKLYVLNKINDDSYICNDRIFKMDGEGNLYKKNTDDSFDIICKYRDLEIEGWSPFIYRKLENIPDYIPRKIDEIIKNYGIKNNFCYEPGNESRYICSDGIYDIFFEESYRYHLLRLSFFDKYILHEDYSENCICILTDLSDYQWLNPPEKYNHLSVLTWDEHSILISAFETVENPNNNALYLYSNLNLN